MTSTDLEIVEGEIVEDGTALAVREETSPTLFGTADPAEVIRAASEAAKPLAKAVRDQGLAIKIQGREYVKVEGWTLLGSMLGVFPVTVWTRKLEDGWEARVEARTRAGEVIGAAEHQCLRSEKTWAHRDDYALRSMAATRATSKALRMPLGFVMQLAGFEATPADEMPADLPRSNQRSTPTLPQSDSEPLMTEAQKKKANTLIGKLRKEGRLTTEEIYSAVGLNAADFLDADGQLHWSPLRDTLPKKQASDLIDLLQKHEESGEQVLLDPWHYDAMPETAALEAELLTLSNRLGKRAEIEVALEKHRGDDGFEEWLQAAVVRARGAAASSEEAA